MKIDGVDVYVHWSVFAISAFILLGAFQQPAMSLVGLTCYIGVLLIHESGHMIIARRKGCEVLDIELYPVWAVTHFQSPRSRFDHSVIAWGGVIAQSAVAVPLVAWVLLFGYTRFEPVNAALVILGFFSLAMAVFNLLPFPPLDGAIAWRIVPELIGRWSRPGRNSDDWTYRR